MKVKNDHRYTSKIVYILKKFEIEVNSDLLLTFISRFMHRTFVCYALIQPLVKHLEVKMYIKVHKHCLLFDPPFSKFIFQHQ